MNTTTPSCNSSIDKRQILLIYLQSGWSILRYRRCVAKALPHVQYD